MVSNNDGRPCSTSTIATPTRAKTWSTGARGKSLVTRYVEICHWFTEEDPPSCVVSWGWTVSKQRGVGFTSCRLRHTIVSPSANFRTPDVISRFYLNSKASSLVFDPNRPSLLFLPPSVYIPVCNFFTIFYFLHSEELFECAFYGSRPLLYVIKESFGIAGDVRDNEGSTLRPCLCNFFHFIQRKLLDLFKC